MGRSRRRLAKLSEALLADVAAMIKAVTAGEADAGKAADARLTAMRAGLDLGEDSIAPSAIAKMTAVVSGERDSLHRLVMDLHKAVSPPNAPRRSLPAPMPTACTRKTSARSRPS
jgi:hypothetical protein